MQCRSKALRDAISDVIDTPGASTLSISVFPDRRILRISADGDDGTCRVDLSTTDSSLFLGSGLDSEPTACSYRLRLMAEAFKGTSFAHVTTIRQSNEGMAAILHRMHVAAPVGMGAGAEGGAGAGASACTIGYFVCADDDSPSDDEAGGDGGNVDTKVTMSGPAPGGIRGGAAGTGAPGRGSGRGVS